MLLMGQRNLVKAPDITIINDCVDFNAFQEPPRRVDVLTWDSAAPESYGTIRATTGRLGRILAPLDLLIAAHGLGAVLVTSDKAFSMVEALPIEDWSMDHDP